MLKILFLSHRFDPDIGGIETNSEILATAFHNYGILVHLLTWTKEHSKRSYPFIIKRNPSICELFIEYNWADVIFENNPCLRLSWPNLLFRKPLVIVLNTWLSRSNGEKQTKDKLKHLWLKRATKIIAVSKAVQKKEWPGALVIKNPYNGELFKLNSTIEKKIKFAFLGRLVSDKGADHAILAIHRLIKDNRNSNFLPEQILTIIGDGPEKGNLRRLVADLKLEDYIRFAGSLTGESLVTTLNCHKYLLVPSIWEEPFGNVVLEGMACGCLPIVSNGGGLPEAVGNAGLTFRRGDIADMVWCINKLLDDPLLEEQLRLSTKLHLAAHDAGVISQKYIKVIKEAFI